MHELRTWDAILDTPVTLDDIVVSELAWAGSKSLPSGVTVLQVTRFLGLSRSLLSLWVIRLALLVGPCFAALGLVVTALIPGYFFHVLLHAAYYADGAIMRRIFSGQAAAGVIAECVIRPAADACDLSRAPAAERWDSRAVSSACRSAAGV